MSEVEKLNLISKVGFILAVFFLLVAVILFLAFNIRKIIMDLMGITEKRAIVKINEENIMKGNDANNITDKISKSGRINERSITSKITTDKIITKKSNAISTETTLLSQPQASQETTLLSQPQASQETTLLSQPQISQETTVLNETQIIQEKESFIIIEDIIYIQSEIIL